MHSELSSIPSAPQISNHHPGPSEGQTKEEKSAGQAATKPKLTAGKQCFYGWQPTPSSLTPCPQHHTHTVTHIRLPEWQIWHMLTVHSLCECLLSPQWPRIQTPWTQTRETGGMPAAEPGELQGISVSPWGSFEESPSQPTWGGLKKPCWKHPWHSVQRKQKTHWHVEAKILQKLEGLCV